MSFVLDLHAILHQRVHDYWQADLAAQKAFKYAPKTRCERSIEASEHRGGARFQTGGDMLLGRIENLFFNGMDVIWSEVQVKIFKELINACLPKVYGSSWDEHKARVLLERSLDTERLFQEVLINMARRNGKTYVVSGTAAVLFLVVPNISIAVFSTGKRTAGMLMDVAITMIDAMFKNGSIVSRSDYKIITQNKEQLVYEGPDGTKRSLGCYPGSVKVRPPRFHCATLCRALGPKKRTR